MTPETLEIVILLVAFIIITVLLGLCITIVAVNEKISFKEVNDSLNNALDGDKK